MSLTGFVASLIASLEYAGLLFLVASGFTLIFGLMRVANLAHGAFYLLGLYFGWVFLQQVGYTNVNYILALVLGALSMGILGVLIERTLLRLVRGQELPEVLITVGIGFIIGDLSIVFFNGGNPVTPALPPFLAPSIPIAGLTQQVPVDRLFVFLLAVGIAIGLWLLTTKTRVGSMIRAGVDDAEMVSALGINIKVVFTAVFFLGAALAGLAGVAGSQVFNGAPGEDNTVLQLGLVVVILGGLGSLPGAVIGSLIVGLILIFGPQLLPDLQYFLLFAPMVIMLAIRPRGLFGRA